MNPRKVTKYHICDEHAGGLATGYRRAEIFCEGGPGWGAPCSPSPCRMWAGTDYFCAEVCYGEYPLDWAVNTPTNLANT